MNRFEEKSRRKKRFPTALLSAAVFLMMVFWAIRGLASLSAATDAQGVESLETALRRSVVHCYATEGFYPPSLEYLEEHYGLTYDKERYWIDYQPVGTNLMPDMTVLEIP